MMGLFDFLRRGRTDAQASATLDTSSGAVQVAPASRGRRPPSAHNVARMMLTGGESNRLTQDWPTMPVPADWIVERYQRTLVARSREQTMNNDFVKAYIRECRNNIVGHAGILFQSKARRANGKPDEEAATAIEAAFADWARRGNCEVTGRHSWKSVQKVCAEAWARDGEYMLRKIIGTKGGKYRFKLQILDPQRCPVDYSVADLPGGGFIRHGIEYTAEGEPVAYFFMDESRTYSSQAYQYSGKRYIRIPAEEIIHDFRTDLIGQKRGIPFVVSALFRAKQMGAYEDAAIVNARVTASKMGVIEWDKDSAGPELEEDESVEIDADPGAFVELPVGAKLNKFEPQYPAGEFAQFIKQMLRSFAAGTGTSYPTLSQDLEGVNFSSIRHGKIDERENWKDLQEQMIEGLCEPVVDAWLPLALLSGNVKKPNGSPLPADRIERYSPYEHQGRRWEWVDPKADVEANVLEKNNLLASPGDIIREKGKDPRSVWLQIAQDIEAMREAGIPEDYIKMAMGQKLNPTKDAPPADNQAPQ